ncbi:kelch repeat-containing protein [Brevibacillus choshinensis]|uniref:kelch repeat-containing protein n=1 Tax=Brevibacillus choshinensis TaxID=54911 RepID=UPI002E1E7B8F|nr:kelch repeat-containing protein [Brevibacillus choshinensis]
MDAVAYALVNQMKQKLKSSSLVWFYHGLVPSTNPYGIPRSCAVGSVGYIYVSGSDKHEFFAYDTIAGTFTPLPLPPVRRYSPYLFSYGNTVFLFGGAESDSNQKTKTLYAFDTVAKTWSQKTSAPFGLSAPTGTNQFTVGSTQYIISYENGVVYDLLAYHMDTDVWENKGPTPSLDSCFAFATGGKGYAGCSYATYVSSREFYEYDPATNAWTSKADVPNVHTRAITISTGGMGYVFGGIDLQKSTDTLQISKYDPSTNQWATIGSVLSIDDYTGSTFNVGNTGYKIGSPKNKTINAFYTNALGMVENDLNVALGWIAGQ